MGKGRLQASSFIFDRIFVKLAVNQGRHKILEVFEFRLDRISHFGVTWGRIKFSIDLLWNLQIRRKYTGYLVGATPLTVFHRLFWNFSDVFCMEWRCVCGLNIILWLFFLTFLLCELSLLLVWIAIKVYRQWVPCGSNSSYSFPPIVLIHCRCFQHGMKMCMWFGYNTLIIFSHFFYFVNLVSFLAWNAIKVYGQWVSCGRNSCNSSYSFSSVVLKLCRCVQYGMKLCMWLWYNPLIFCFSLPLQFSDTGHVWDPKNWTLL